MDLSIVTTLYRSSSTLEEFCQRASTAARAVAREYEIILVNDGSPDDSLERALALARNDPHLVVVDLSRNFGHHRALLTGLAYAEGESVFVLDGDLEEDPDWLMAFERVRRDQSADVVYGIQQRRKGGWLERTSGWLFYRMFNWLSRTPIPPSAVIARLMTRRYVDALLSYPEREVFLPGLWQLAGYRQAAVPVVKGSKGATTYNLTRRVALAVNAITSFTDRPMIYIFYTGALICAISLLGVARIIFLKLVRGVPIRGWASLIISIWFLGGLTIFFVGILGVYLSKVFLEIKQRPRSVVRNVYPAGRSPRAGNR